jgi:hypothetical protein
MPKLSRKRERPNGNAESSESQLRLIFHAAAGLPANVLAYGTWKPRYLWNEMSLRAAVDYVLYGQGEPLAYYPDRRENQVGSRQHNES